MAKKKPSTKKKPVAKPSKKAAPKPSAKAPVKKAPAAKPAAKPAPKKKAPAATTTKKTTAAKATAPAAAPAKAKTAPKTAGAPKKPAPKAATPAPAAPVKAAAPAKPAPTKTKPTPAKAPVAKSAPAKPAKTAGSPKPAKGSSRSGKPSVPAKSDAETFAEAQAAAARLAAIAGIRPIESRPFEEHDENAASKRLTKSPLSKKEMTHYKELLLRKRAEIMGDVESMEDEALLSGDRMSHTPNHMAEQGSDVYGQTLSLDIAASQRKLVVEIEEALHRIEEGTYGVCIVMGTPIGKARLDAKPWAKLCIEAARRLERGGSLA